MTNYAPLKMSLAIAVGSGAGTGAGTGAGIGTRPRSNKDKNRKTSSESRKKSAVKEVKKPPEEQSARLSHNMFLGPADTVLDLSSITSNSSHNVSDAFINIGQLGSRHLQPIRPDTARTEREVVTLKLRELNKEVIDTLESVAGDLKRLEICKANVACVPVALVTHLNGLRKLVLNFNKLNEKSFPESFGSLATLKELSVAYNELTCLPKPWTKLRHLLRLNVEGNKIVNLSGIDQMRRLTVLVVDNNCLTELSSEISSLRHLEGLFAKQNKLKNLRAHMKNLRRLRILNAAHNQLDSISAEVFCLPRLEYLCLNNNSLTRLQVFSTQTFQGRRIALIDLSENQLIRLPDHVLRISTRLDLSGNKIRNIATTVLKRFYNVKDQELDLRNNPLVHPPVEVCEGGLRAMIRHCREIDEQPVVYQGVKLYVFGACGAGKTSLIRSLIDQQPLLAEPEEQTNGIGVLETLMEISEPSPESGGNSSPKKTDGTDDSRSKKSVFSSFWEFGGGERAIPLLSHFIRDSALVIIAFDASTYRCDKFGETIGVWMELVLAKYFKAHVLLVATHIDLLPSGKLQTLNELVLTDMRGFLRNRLTLIDRDVRSVESNPTISSTLSEYYSHLLRVKDAEIVLVHGEVLLTSALNFTGYVELDKHVQRVIRTMPMIYNLALKPYPGKYAEIEHYVEAIADQEPVIELEKFAGDLARTFSLTSAKTSEVTSYMHLNGRLIWLPNDNFFSQQLVLRPELISDALYALFNFELLYKQSQADDSQPQSKSERFGKLTLQHFYRHGLVNLEFLRFLWTQLSPCLTNQQVLPVAQLIFENFELGFSAEDISYDELAARNEEERASRAENGANTPRSERSLSAKSLPASRTPSGKAPVNGNGNGDSGTDDEFGVQVFVPAVKSTPSDGLLEELRELHANNLQICPVYEIFNFAAPLIYERLCGRLSNLGVTVYSHWQNGLLARHKKEPQMVLRIEKEYIAYSQLTCIKVAVYAPAETPKLPEIDTRVRDSLSRRSSVISRSSLATSSYSASVPSVRASRRRSSVIVQPISLPVLAPSPDPKESLPVGPLGLAYSSANQAQSEIMWSVLLPVLRDLDNLLHDYPGLWYRRMLRCPVCLEICFNAEWNSREYSEVSDLICLVCSSSVPMYLLSPPRKRRTEDILKLRQELKEKRTKDHKAAPQAASTTATATAPPASQPPPVINNTSENKSKRRKSVVLNTLAI